MDAIKEYNDRWKFFQDITGEAMRVHAKYHPGLLESAYHAALEYLLDLKGYKVEDEKLLPIYWDDVKLDKKPYKMDVVVNDNIILELKAIKFVSIEHRKQLWNYMHLTHIPYGMLINFGGDHLYSEWYHRDEYGRINQIKLM